MPSRLSTAFPILALLACSANPEGSGDSAQAGDSGPMPVDADQDGWPEDEDCDDSDPAIHPDADEVCDGVDNDCDGTVDAGARDAPSWYHDEDGDEYGDYCCVIRACEQPKGRVADNTDCDDGDASIHPGAPEACDGVDSDCDALTDEDDPDADCPGHG